MHPLRILLPALMLAAVLAEPGRAQNSDDTLLGRAKLSLVSAKKRRVSLRARWTGAGPGTPAPADATLRIVGGPGEGDSGRIMLPADGWTVRKKGRLLRYLDRSGSAGGIRKVLLRFGKKGGSLKIAGGTENWSYDASAPQSRVAVILEIGGARWCTEFGASDLDQKSGRVRGKSTTAPAECPCADEFDSTWDAIQFGIFARHGCTDAVCHGAPAGEAQGGLDLRPESAYEALVDATAEADPNLTLVIPGDASASLLWRKLAAKIRDGIDIPNSAMPSGGAAPLSEDELRVIERWIYSGAPREGVVEDTANLLASCLPPPDPQKIPRPVPPDPAEGVEIFSPPWSIPIGSEDEVCIGVPYDFSDRIPMEHRFPCPDVWGGPTKECFAFRDLTLTQDPNSHHSIWRPYRGGTAIDDPVWGPYACHGGATDGTPCDPTALHVPAPSGGDCGAESACATDAQSALACIGFGPPDLQLGMGLDLASSATAPSVLISTEPLFGVAYPTGVASVHPVAGLMVVNSHAFNVTDQATTNEQWMHYFYAPVDERLWAIKDIFDADDIFAQNVPPFEEREYCRTITFEKGTHLYNLYSHTHKYGRLFRAWMPPIATECTASQASCLPEDGNPFLVTTDFSDPDNVVFDPPLALDSDDPAERRMKYCAIYDNGFTDPAEVKRNSVALEFGAPPCNTAVRACTGGPNKGELCGGDDALCPEAECDACPVRGGVTTEEEMFILLGAFYCPDDTSCFEPLL